MNKSAQALEWLLMWFEDGKMPPEKEIKGARQVIDDIKGMMISDKREGEIMIKNLKKSLHKLEGLIDLLEL